MVALGTQGQNVSCIGGMDNNKELVSTPFILWNGTPDEISSLGLLGIIWGTSVGECLGSDTVHGNTSTAATLNLGTIRHIVSVIWTRI